LAYKCWGVSPKNLQQQECMKHLLDPYIDLVIMQGVAGSGKTLLALAAGLECTLNDKQYSEIIFTRAPVSVGSDMGHLPGDINEKMLPWCGAVLDNMEMLLNSSKMSKLQKDATSIIMENKIKFAAMMHMRGRSLTNKWVIIDEVQNISIPEIKVLLTRAGEGSKIICMGDVNQIDNRKLDVNSNALSYLMYKGQDAQFIKYVDLPTCERSRLAAWAAKVL
jgi:PhoH-like ATPase